MTGVRVGQAVVLATLILTAVFVIQQNDFGAAVGLALAAVSIIALGVHCWRSL